MKNLITVFLALAMFAVIFAQPAEPSTGDGTLQNPYLIENLNNLQWLSENSNEWNKHYIQTADIDATDTENWNDGSGFNSIGNTTVKFSGQYNGRHNKISNLFINRPEARCVGLFGKTDEAIIQDVIVKNFTYTAQRYIGGVVGTLDDDSQLINSSACGTINGETMLGGLVGYNDGASTIKGCWANCSVTGTTYRVGGLIGYAGRRSKALNCYSFGNINGNDNVGGLIGFSRSAEVSNCYSIASVTSTGTNAGGLIGKKSSGTIESSYWNIETANQNNSDGGTSKTTSEMKQQVTYEGWDFVGETANGENEIWNIEANKNSGYPFLAWQEFEEIEPPYTLDGDGSGANPYLIQSLQDLIFLSENHDIWAKFFKQTVDIDASNTENLNNGNGFLPIGNETNAFLGNYNGDKHCIENLKINFHDSTNIALFGYAKMATIENLYLKNCNISGGENVGAIIGKSTMYSCVQNCSASGEVLGNTNVGGLVGFGAYRSKIKKSYSTCSVTGTSYVAGLVGNVDSYSSIKIENCYAVCTLQATDNIKGFIGGSSYAEVNNSYWDTEVSGQTESNGGTGKTTAEMKLQATYETWDFVGETANGENEIWNIHPNKNSGYPFLAWQQFEEVEPPVALTGAGTEEDPYIIGSIENLKYLSENESLWDKHFSQVIKIDATVTESWNDNSGFNPIGNQNKSFTGFYNGNNFSITNLTINKPDSNNVALFGCAWQANIKNLCIINCDIKGKDNTGALVGDADFNTVIQNCCSTGGITGNENVGGLVGYGGYCSTIKNSFSSCSVRGESNCAGLAGNTNSLTVFNCYSSGAVHANTNAFGLIAGDTYPGVFNSYWDIETSNQTQSNGGTGKTTTEMKLKATYETWDFVGETVNGTDDIWAISHIVNNGYPCFGIQITDVEDKVKPTNQSPATINSLNIGPNPFNPCTTIRFNLSKTQNVNVKIYNLKGQMVKNFYNGTLQKGKQSLNWNANNLSSGIYFVKVNAGKNSVVKKAILLK